MLQFRKQKPTSKLDSIVNRRLLILRPESFEDLPMEVIEKILSFIDMNDRQSFRQTSSHFRAIHDQFLDHLVVKKVMVQGGDDCSTTFLEEFCKLIYLNTQFFHRIAFPQFLNIFLCHRDLMSIKSLHSSVIFKISNAKFIGDISDIFEKLILQYLAVVQAGCGSGRNKFRMLLIASIITLLNASRCLIVHLIIKERSRF